MAAGIKYLMSRLKKVLEHTGADASVVAEYLSTFDATTQRNDMKAYLGELAGGREVEIADIVEEYCKRRLKKENASLAPGVIIMQKILAATLTILSSSPNCSWCYVRMHGDTA